MPGGMLPARSDQTGSVKGTFKGQVRMKAKEQEKEVQDKINL